MSIASAIEDLKGRIEDAYDVVEERGGTLPQTLNSYNLPDAIDSIPEGQGGSAEWKDLNFIDYDGTLVHSFTKEEGLALTQMPSPPPEHEGLTFQEWNYSLESIKRNLNSSGSCCVGASFIPTDGKTHIWIKIEDPYYNTVTLFYHQTQAYGVQVDWGDGTEARYSATVGDTAQTHVYAGGVPETYEIKMRVGAGELKFLRTILADGTNGVGNPVQTRQSMVQEVWLGNGVTEISATSSVVTSTAAPFGFCRRMEKIVIPNGVTRILDYSFAECSSLQSVSLPNGVTIGGSVFYNCGSLQSVSIPDGVKIIGTQVFYLCRSLQNISLPDSVTSIGTYAFNGCSSLQSISIPDGVTRIMNSSLYGCYALQSISIPDGVTRIMNSSLYGCYSLQSISIPDSVTNIGISAFLNCISLQSISIPDGVTSIESSAFYGCYGLITYDFSNATQIPSLANANAFNHTSNFKRILVPAELYEDWKAATNWSTYAQYIYSVDPSLCFISTEDGSTISLNAVGNQAAISLQYKTSVEGTWQTYVLGTTLTANAGGKIYFRNPTTTFQSLGFDEDNYNQFHMTGGWKAQGRLGYLNKSDATDGMAISAQNYCYYKLFSGCSALLKAPALPTGQNAYAEFAYAYMFEGCTGLTQTPPNFEKLKAFDTEGQFFGMFKGCTGLTNATIPFTGEDSFYGTTPYYGEVFMNCSNLREIDATSISPTVDSVFDDGKFTDWVKGVASEGLFLYNNTMDLTHGDGAIPTGWTVEKRLYDGFAVEALMTVGVQVVKDGNAPTLQLEISRDEGKNWSNYTVGDTLNMSSGERICFRGTNSTWGGSSNSDRNRFVFDGGAVKVSGNLYSLLTPTNYNSLTDISDRSRCFQYLFYGATNLTNASELKLPATTISGWAYCNMFEGCTNLTYPPEELPATTLSGTNWIYSAMFSGCTALRKSPYIKAMVIPNNCCAEMFKNCSNLTDIYVEYSGGFGTGAFNNWVSGVGSTGTFHYNGISTTTGNSNIPSGWTIEPFIYEGEDRDCIRCTKAALALNYVPTSNTKIIGTFKGEARGHWYIGNSDSSSMGWRFFNSDNKLYLDVTGGRLTSDAVYDMAQWYTIEASNLALKATPQYGTTINLNGTAQTVSTTDPLKFGSATYTYSGAGVNFLCGGFKIYEGSALVKDYVPAKDSNDVACFHEMVGDTYVYPTSGTFLAYIKD